MGILDGKRYFKWIVKIKIKINIKACMDYRINLQCEKKNDQYRILKKVINQTSHNPWLS